MNKTKVIFVRSTPEQHERIKVDAKKESRSVGNFLLWCYEQRRRHISQVTGAKE